MEKKVRLVLTTDADARLVRRIQNTVETEGLELAHDAPAECVLRTVTVTANEITVGGQLVATVESVLRDDSPTFKIDALAVGLMSPQALMREPTNREHYVHPGRHGWISTQRDWLATFAADVDTASYTIGRRKLLEGTLPSPASVRVEEYVNYFRYPYQTPSDGSPFAVTMDAAPSPLAPRRHILRVGVATKPKPVGARLPAHLVFLVDVSGSMDEADKLGLAKESLRILTRNLTPADTVSLVTYAGGTSVVLEPTSAAKQRVILRAIDSLSAGGSTAMASGIDLAYERAARSLKAGHTSRVIVLSDGDANVGATTHEAILELIADRARKGVTLSTIGFGMGNYNDHLMEQLADNGDGNSFYVDSLDEARRIFSDELTATIEVVARDVKLQVDFNPTVVAQYRQLGYENRDVPDAQFRVDSVDAGDVGAGHQVTALYEVELTRFGALMQLPLGAVRIRHKTPDGVVAPERLERMSVGPLLSFVDAASDFRLAYAVAAFADLLRRGEPDECAELETIRALAAAAAPQSEILVLIDQAIAMRARSAPAAVQARSRSFCT